MFSSHFQTDHTCDFVFLGFGVSAHEGTWDTKRRDCRRTSLDKSVKVSQELKVIKMVSHRNAKKTQKGGFWDE